MKQSSQHFVDEVATLMAELDEHKIARRATLHQLTEQKNLVSRLALQIKTMQTLNLGLLSTLEGEQIYTLVCENLVYQLGWDSALVVALRANQAVILGAHQVTQKQLGSIRDYLPGNKDFAEAYVHRQALSTYASSATGTLALRTLFQTDELVALPVLFGEHLFGYLVVCAHNGHHERPFDHDMNFLASIAAQVAHAVQNSVAFRDLEAQNTKLRQLDELKNSFISITSHQLRTPLSIVKWILSILQSDPEIVPLEKQRRMMEQAYESNERLIHVVNDLLNVSRIEDGRLPYNPQLTDLRAMIADLCQDAEKACQSKELRFESQLADTLPLCEIDSLLLKEALQNLIDNALDYNVVNGWIKITLEADSQVIITIANSGMGISKEDATKIFDQFYRSAQAVRQHPNGNGLGLYLAQAIVKQHGGEITFHSEPDEQTVFTVRIPLKQVA